MPIVTISRQPGSLAVDIVKIVAERYNLEVIDQEIIHNLATDCDPRYKDACTLYEKEVFTSFFERLMLDRPAYRSLFEALHYDLAARGGVIIFGRGAQFAFQGWKSVIKARLVANRDTRVARIMEQQNISHRHAEDFDDHYISRHRSVISSVFEHDVRDAELYDIILNTSYFNAEQGADILCQVIEHKKNGPDLATEKAIFKRLAVSKKIETMLRQEVAVPPHRIFNVTFNEDGKVELQGFVEKKEHVDRATKLAGEYPGVTSVDNQLRSLQAPYMSYL
jgi:cytidylate kinase